MIIMMAPDITMKIINMVLNKQYSHRLTRLRGDKTALIIKHNNNLILSKQASTNGQAVYLTRFKNYQATDHRVIGIMNLWGIILMKNRLGNIKFKNHELHQLMKFNNESYLRLTMKIKLKKC